MSRRIEYHAVLESSDPIGNKWAVICEAKDLIQSSFNYVKQDITEFEAKVLADSMNNSMLKNLQKDD